MEAQWRSCEGRPLGESGGQQAAAEESRGKQEIRRLVKYSELQVWGISTKQYLWGWGWEEGGGMSNCLVSVPNPLCPGQDLLYFHCC